MRVIRAGWSRLDAGIALLAAAVGAFTIVLGEPSRVAGERWVLVEASALALGLVRRLPILVLVVQGVLLFLTDAIVPVDSHVAPLAGMIALGMVAYRHRWAITGVALAGAYAAALVVVARDGDRMLTGTDGLVRAASIALAVAAPVLLGRYIAGLHRAAEIAEERVREADERREAEMQATRLAERARIAGDLHDLVAHYVSAIALQAGSAHYAATHLPDSEERNSATSHALKVIHTNAGQALVDLRGLLRVLRDPIDQESLADPEQMIADAVERSRSAGLEVEARIDDRATEAPLSLRVTAARVVQEGLTNALKHAGPGTSVRTVVDLDTRRLRVEVTDSGSVSLRPRLPASGHGLAGMRERVEILGGTLAVGPVQAGGWQLRADLPLAARP